MRYVPLPLDDIRGVLGRPPVVLLESARPEHGPAHSYLFLEPLEIVRADRLDDVLPALGRVSALSGQHWIAGYVTYEAGYAFEPCLRSIAPPRPRPGPLLWFGVYRKPCVFDHGRGIWLRRPPALSGSDDDSAGAAAGAVLRPAIRRAEYLRAIARIKRCIAAGETYQVNFTFDNILRSADPPLRLLQRLRAGQPVPFGAYIDTGRNRILSFSPELFFARRGNRILTRPMKGTAPRGPTAQEDQAIRRALATDPKNRAENVMIVDLLRNDMGRICRSGSISAGPLFAVETHPTLHQMTSSVRGRLRPGIGLADIFRALFPCGSVTGAPKIRTMQIIRRLERGARGVYCGAIGFAAPGNHAVFSVAIRTLEQERPGPRWRYRVGSGIVWDSRAGDEWEECLLKTGFLTWRPSYHLVETLLWRRERLVYLRDHIARMRNSAAALGFVWNEQRVLRLTASIARCLRGRPCRRVRMLLAADGRLWWESYDLEPPAALGAPLIYLWPERIDPHEPLLYHKTTERRWYRAAEEARDTVHCWDIIFVNRRGEITEGTRTTVFARIGGRLYTPPVACGLLPGVLRGRLLASGACSERVLKPDDLRRADALYCGNSVRGLVAVRCAGWFGRDARADTGHRAPRPPAPHRVRA